MAVAALADWHGRHAEALELLGAEPRIPAHAALECYSVLTQLPQPYRVPPAIAREGLALRFSEAPLTLPNGVQARLVETLAGAGVSGGASYDGLVGLTAAAAGATLFSLDRRAARTYARLGIEYELAGASGP